MQRWLLVLCVLLLHGCAVPGEVHVAPNGSDHNPGTALRPLATLHRAQSFVRQRLSVDPDQAVSVLIHPGTYELDAPLVLGPDDSGTAEHPVTWRAADPQRRPVLSAGREITATWQPSDKPGVWFVDVPGTQRRADGRGWNFRQLFVDGERATRARFPNRDADNPFMYATGGGRDHALIDPALIKDGWLYEQDAQINIVVHWLFFNQWNTIASIDQDAGRLNFTEQERNGVVNARPGRTNWFWIEGVFAELDRPGEWYLDRDAGRLYYMPEPGKDPNTIRFVAPRLDRIIHARGDVEAGTHVRHVHLDSLDFRHTAFTLGHIAPRVHTDAAVRFENTLDSAVTNCSFSLTGGYAFWLHLDSRRNTFDHNTATDLGGGGVLLTGARLSYMDDAKVFTPGEAASKVAPILNRITRNTVERCGRIRYYGGGVHLDSRPASMAMMPGNYIAHNHFADLSRNGIFAFRNQGGNVIEYNHIHDAMQTTIDGACIHFATMSHLNAPNHILNNWLHDVWGYQQIPAGNPIRHPYTNAVFLDWDTSNTTVRGNYAYNVAGEPYKVIWDNWNVVNEDNHASPTRIVPLFVDEVGPGGEATHGIDLEANRLTGGVIHYSDEEHVTRAGDWRQQSLRGMSGLFTFNQLWAPPNKHQAMPPTITYTLPIPEPGTYRVALLYKPDKANATNAEVLVLHADGVDKRRWDMTRGNRHGFAVEVGTYRFEPGRSPRVVITSDGADGRVVADSVVFVKVEPGE